MKRLKPENIRFLVVHCSDTDDDLNAEDIHELHLGFGWDGVGYHKIIPRNGTIQNGRPEFWVGAHVYQHNHESLGVCLIGRKNFSQKQMNALESILKTWQKKYPNARICGHRDFENTQKTCPNFNVTEWAKTRNITS